MYHKNKTLRQKVYLWLQELEIIVIIGIFPITSRINSFTILNITTIFITSLLTMINIWQKKLKGKIIIFGSYFRAYQEGEWEKTG